MKAPTPFWTVVLVYCNRKKEGCWDGAHTRADDVVLMALTGILFVAYRNGGLRIFNNQGEQPQNGLASKF